MTQRIDCMNQSPELTKKFTRLAGMFWLGN